MLFQEVAARERQAKAAASPTPPQNPVSKEGGEEEGDQPAAPRTGSAERGKKDKDGKKKEEERRREKGKRDKEKEDKKKVWACGSEQHGVSACAAAPAHVHAPRVHTQHCMALHRRAALSRQRALGWCRWDRCIKDRY